MYSGAGDAFFQCSDDDGAGLERVEDADALSSPLHLYYVLCFWQSLSLSWYTVLAPNQMAEARSQIADSR